MAGKVKFSVPERLWAKVAMIGAGPDECWEWRGSLDRTGYGKLHVAGKPQWTHRVAWEVTFGPIPPGLDVCHHCDNRHCVRPSHLFVGTRSENMQDCARKGRLALQRRRRLLADDEPPAAEQAS